LLLEIFNLIILFFIVFNKLKFEVKLRIVCFFYFIIVKKIYKDCHGVVVFIGKKITFEKLKLAIKTIKRKKIFSKKIKI
jgi:hypothetical protein